jgi:hypothetical protein
MMDLRRSSGFMGQPPAWKVDMNRSSQAPTGSEALPRWAAVISVMIVG